MFGVRESEDQNAPADVCGTGSICCTEPDCGGSGVAINFTLLQR